MSDGYRCKTIRRECASANARVALGKPGPGMKSKRHRASIGMEVRKSSQKWSVQRSAVRSIAWLDVLIWQHTISSSKHNATCVRCKSPRISAAAHSTPHGKRGSHDRTWLLGTGGFRIQSELFRLTRRATAFQLSAITHTWIRSADAHTSRPCEPVSERRVMSPFTAEGFLFGQRG